MRSAVVCVHTINPRENRLVLKSSLRLVAEGGRLSACRAVVAAAPAVRHAAMATLDGGKLPDAAVAGTGQQAPRGPTSASPTDPITGPQSATNTLRCGRCSSTTVTYYQLQVRSADEPMTSFCTCVSCGHRWRL